MTIETNRLCTALLIALLLPYTAGSARAQPLETEVEVDLRAEVHRVHLLEPGAQVVSGEVLVDSAESVRWVFGSPSKTLEIELTSPNGSTFSLADPDTADARSVIFPDPSDPRTTGANYLFALNAPQPGTWSYRIEETATLSDSRAVLLNFFSSSPVRAAILGGGAEYRVDRPVNLALVTAEGSDLLTNVSLSASARGIDGTSFPETSLSFLDDGGAPDVDPGDGMFTADFLPGAPGSYQVVAEISGQRSNGDAFQRTATAQVEVLPVQATLNGAFSDRGIDLNGDGLLDRIGVSPSIEILAAGEYNVTVTLESSAGASLTSNHLASYPAGITNPEVLFSAEDVKETLAADGPYDVAEVRVEAIGASAAATVDAAFNLGVTAPYRLTDLQRRAIQFVGNGVSTGVDVDGNGRFDFLDVNLDVDFLDDAFFQWSARLVDDRSTEVALDGGSGFFEAGNGSLSLRFNGTAIGENGVDGPYFVRNLVVFGNGKSLIVDDPFTTRAFLASEFEGFVADTEPPQLTVAATPATLWPPNHELIEISVDIQVSDNLDPDPQVLLEAVTSNEGDNMVGDGNTTDDIQIGPDGEIFLRAERSGTGDGRVYTLTYSARDAAGNSTQATTRIAVAKSQKP